MAIRKWWVRLTPDIRATFYRRPRGGRRSRLPSPAPPDSRFRPGLVPARSARRRPRRPVPRAASRRGASTARSSSTPRSSTPARRAPTAASSSSGTACVELNARLADAGGALIVVHGRAREEIPRSRESLGVECGLRQPRLRAGRDRRDDAVQARARRRGPRAAHVQGPGDLRARRGAHRGRHAVLGIHALQERVAEEARPPSISAPTAGPPTAAPGRPTPRTVTRRCPRWTTSASRATNLRELRIPTGMSGARTLFEDFLHAHRRLSRDARFSRGEGAVVPVGAPALRHGVDPRAGAARARAGRAGRAAPGCPS